MKSVLEGRILGLGFRVAGKIKCPKPKLAIGVQLKSCY